MFTNSTHNTNSWPAQQEVHTNVSCTWSVVLSFIDKLLSLDGSQLTTTKTKYEMYGHFNSNYLIKYATFQSILE